MRFSQVCYHFFTHFTFLNLNILNLPVNRFYPIGFQKFISLAEMLASEKSPVGRKGTWMWCFQDQMLRIMKHGCLHLSRPPPEKKHDRAILLVQDPDGRIGKLFPADPSVGIG